MGTVLISRLTAQQVSHAVITAAMKVHSELGAGLLESTYTACLQYELSDAGFRSSAQVGLPVVYRGVKLDLGYRMDLLVENLVVVEMPHRAGRPRLAAPARSALQSASRGRTGGTHACGSITWAGRSSGAT